MMNNLDTAGTVHDIVDCAASGLPNFFCKRGRGKWTSVDVMRMHGLHAYDWTCSTQTRDRHCTLAWSKVKLPSTSNILSHTLIQDSKSIAASKVRQLLS